MLLHLLKDLRDILEKENAPETEQSRLQALFRNSHAGKAMRVTGNAPQKSATIHQIHRRPQ